MSCVSSEKKIILTILTYDKVFTLSSLYGRRSNILKAIYHRHLGLVMWRGQGYKHMSTPKVPVDSIAYGRKTVSRSSVIQISKLIFIFISNITGP